MIHVLFVGPFGIQTGYGQACHDYLLALHRAGMSLDIQPIIGFDTANLDERYDELLPRVIGYPKHVATPPTHLVVHTVPGAAAMIARDYPASIPKILITTWETSRLPSQLAAEITHAYDCVVVPSEFCADVMDVGDAIRIVPHCFDPEHWPVLEGLPKNTDPYRFYSIVSWAERKNPIGLLKAYLSAFTAMDDVELVIKTPGCNQEDVTALVGSLGYDDYPNVVIETEHSCHEDLVDFHRGGHCYVSTSRGEGWNLPAFEAALLGKPVITPTWGGQTEFLTDYGNVYFYSGTMTPAICPPQADEAVNLDGVNVRAVKKIAPSGITARQDWFEPDLKALRILMRRAYEDRLSVDMGSRSMLESSFSYATVGPQLAKVIEDTTCKR